MSQDAAFSRVADLPVAAVLRQGPPAAPTRLRALPALLLAIALLVLASLWTLAAEDELSLGRKPWQEFNIRDSTILGLVGAGGFGLLLSEAMSLFQWGRLGTLLLAIVVMVTAFDAVSRSVRSRIV